MEVVYRVQAGDGRMKGGAPFGNKNVEARWNPPAGTIRRGIRLDSDMVGRLRRAYASGVDRVVLKERFNVSQVTLSKILNRRTWKDVP